MREEAPDLRCCQGEAVLIWPFSFLPDASHPLSSLSKSSLESKVKHSRALLSKSVRGSAPGPQVHFRKKTKLFKAFSWL